MLESVRHGGVEVKTKEVNFFEWIFQQFSIEIGWKGISINLSWVHLMLLSLCVGAWKTLQNRCRKVDRGGELEEESRESAEDTESVTEEVEALLELPPRQFKKEVRRRTREHGTPG